MVTIKRKVDFDFHRCPYSEDIQVKNTSRLFCTFFLSDHRTKAFHINKSISCFYTIKMQILYIICRAFIL